MSGVDARRRWSSVASARLRLTPANAAARKPMNVIAELDDGEEPARVADQAADASGPAPALLDELLDAAAADR